MAFLTDLRQARHKVVQGYTLLYALVALIIISAFSLFILSTFNLCNRTISIAKRRDLSFLYCYQGLSYIDSLKSDGYDYNFEYGKDFRLHVSKKQWGLYEVYSAVIIAGTTDTVNSKLALIGLQRDTAINIGLFLRNTNATFYLSENVIVSGNCYIPLGFVKKYGNTGASDLPKQQVMTSPDTLPSLKNADTLINRIFENRVYSNSILKIKDTVTISFLDTTLVLNADTVIIDGSLSGNILVAAKRLFIHSNAKLSGIVLAADDIYISDYFNGSCQLFATDSILIGQSVAFNYPSIVGLFPNRKAMQQAREFRPTIQIGDSLRLYGEIYAYAKDYNISSKLDVNVGKGSFIKGGIYTNSNLSWQGTCLGTIICDKIIYQGKGSVYENMISNVTIHPDSLSNFYCYSLLFPLSSEKKVVAWLK